MLNTKENLHTLTEITLAKHKLWSIEGDRRGDVISCLNGTLWITQEGDLKDYILDYVDGYVNYFPKHLKVGFPLGLLLLERGPIIFMGKSSPFSKLNLNEREQYVKSWINSRIQLRRELIRGVKGLVMVAFYSHPLVMEHIGYDIKGHIAESLKKEFR